MLVTLIRLPSELGYEKVAMASAAVIAKRMGFSSDRIDDIKTAIAEACINAIEHGNDLDAAAPVIIELGQNIDGLEIRVSDTGCQPFPSALPDLRNGLCARGWGLALIQNLVDEFDLSTTPHGGNTIRMRLRLVP